MIKLSDIKRFYFNGNYHVNISWAYLEEAIDDYLKRHNLDLNPDFQRGHVWTDEKQIAYVEFIIRGGQSSKAILFNHPNWMGNFKGDFVLVDGKQRLEAVRKFIRNELPVFNGNLLSDFDDPRMVLRKCDFEFYVNSLKTRKEVLEWYLQLNSGGVVHTEEELNKVKKMLENT